MALPVREVLAEPAVLVVLVALVALVVLVVPAAQVRRPAAMREECFPDRLMLVAQDDRPAAKFPYREQRSQQVPPARPPFPTVLLRRNRLMTPRDLESVSAKERPPQLDCSISHPKFKKYWLDKTFPIAIG